MPDFLIFALIAGCAVAAVAGPLGSLVVWQRLAYFGDTLAHSALLGTALGLLLEIDPWWTIVGGSLLIGLLLASMQGQREHATDSVLGIISHGGLALGLVAISLAGSGRIDLNAYLFGDLLAVGASDLWLIGLLGVAILALLARFWDALLAVTVHDELAAVEGLPVQRLRVLQMLLMALLVAVAMRVVGVLLVTALLIIPPNVARPWARTPEQMAVFAGLAGVLAVLAGVAVSVWLDTPTGASIVVCTVAAFLVSFALRKAVPA
jgi:zinc transport system permease protein